MAITYTLEQSMHLKRQEQGFTIVRDSISCYLFCHFINPVDIVSGGKLIRTAPNACYLCSPGKPVYYKAEIMELLHNFLHFQVDDPAAFAAKGVPLDRVFYTDMQEGITRDVEYIEWVQCDRKPQHLKRLNAMVDAFFDGLAEEQKKNKVPLGRNSDASFDNLRSMIYISPGDWSVDSMANFVHLSRSHFSVKYRDRFGIPPHKDLNEAAMLLATRHLTSGHAPIAEIAAVCGFRTPEYFIRMFKHAKGITPGSYREKYYAENAGGEVLGDAADVLK